MFQFEYKLLKEKTQTIFSTMLVVLVKVWKVSG